MPSFNSDILVTKVGRSFVAVVSFLVPSLARERPLLKFFNDDYVYIFLAKAVRGYGSHYIYNRKKNEGFLLKEGKPFFMYPCFGIIDNVLLAICQPDELSQYMDRNLMSPQEIHKMETLKEDDNPVILKYYLK